MAADQSRLGSILNDSVVSCSNSAFSTLNETENKGANTDRTCFCLTSYTQSENKKLIQAIEGLGAEYKSINSTEELRDLMTHKHHKYFIVDNFSGEPFSMLYKSKCKIFGAPAVIGFYQTKNHIPRLTRPLYSSTLIGVVLCFTGFRQKDDLSQLCALVHHLGGSVRRDFSGKVTHLIAHSVQGQKYKAAVSLGTHIMTEQWIHQCWKMRDNIEFRGTDESCMEKFKMPPFHGLTVSFLGFPEDERIHMEETCLQNGTIDVAFFSSK